MINKTIDFFTLKEHKLLPVFLARWSILLWLLLSAALAFPYRHDYYSDSAFIKIQANIDGFFLWRIIFLKFFQSNQIIFYYAQILALLFAMSGRLPRISWIVVVILTHNLWAKAWVTMDGGNNLASILMIYLTLCNTSGKPYQPKHRLLRWSIYSAHTLHNAGWLLSVIQVAIVYFTTGFLKADGNLWQNGMALYYVLQSRAYSTPAIGDFIVKYPEFSVIGTYFTIGFQWVFPSLVWFRQTRPYVFTAGILLHTGIALAMGLLLFGLVMMLTYFLFIEEKTAERILNTFKRVIPFKTTIIQSKSNYAAS